MRSSEETATEDADGVISKSLKRSDLASRSYRVRPLPVLTSARCVSLRASERRKQTDGHWLKNAMGTPTGRPQSMRSRISEQLLNSRKSGLSTEKTRCTVWHHPHRARARSQTPGVIITGAKRRNPRSAHAQTT
jgi:hypothetical protein